MGNADKMCKCIYLIGF